jgi:hypothetical protein
MLQLKKQLRAVDDGVLAGFSAAILNLSEGRIF